MPNPPSELLEYLLRQCAGLAPQPWYPSSFQEPSVPTQVLDEALDKLRLGGLVHLTDWVQGKGQGYALTPEGTAVVGDAGALSRLRQGQVPELEEKPPPPRRPETAYTPWERGEAVRAALLEPPQPLITKVLLTLNILMFVGGIVLAVQERIPLGRYLAPGRGDDPDNIAVREIQYQMGALSAPVVFIWQQWWRLLSYMFVHAGVLHLFMNMYALYVLGPLVEAMWGRARFLALYLISGLGGGVLVILLGGACVGASGALCGMVASMGIWVLQNRSYLSRELTSHWLNNIMTNIVLVAIISFLPGVSAAGHLGGGVAGAVVAFPLLWHRFEHGFKRALGLAGTIAVPLVLAAAVYWSMNRGPIREAVSPDHPLPATPWQADHPSFPNGSLGTRVANGDLIP